MSLMDALLLESADLKAPMGERVVFMALRKDGLGSGTIDDPWNGSTWRGQLLSADLELGDEVFDVELAWDVHAYPNVTVQFEEPHGCAVGDWITIAGEESGQYNGTFQIITVPSNTSLGHQNDPSSNPTGSDITCSIPRIVTVTAPGHELAVEDIVEVAGVEGDSADWFNGLFLVDTVSGNTFTYRIRSANNDPSGAATTCQKVVYQLDRWLHSQPANTAIHLGPGVFETRGTQDTAWRFYDGQKIIGSGIGITTLKLVMTGLSSNAAIIFDPNRLVREFGISDLTCDCNMTAHPVGGPYSSVATGAAHVWGSHSRICRIRAIDFGTRNEIECFVMGGGGSVVFLGTAVNCVLEDCIIEKPDPASSYALTCLHFTSQENAAGIMTYSRACTTRDCWVNGILADGNVHPWMQPLSTDGGTAMVTAANRIFNCPKGAYHDTWSTRDLISRGDYFYNCGTGMYQHLSATGNRKGQGFVLPNGAGRNLATLTSELQGSQYFAHAPLAPGISHNLEVGDGVEIRNVDPETSPYNGSHVITAVSDSTNEYWFEYSLGTDPGDATALPGTSIQFQRIYQVRFLCDQENHVNLAPYTLNVSKYGFLLHGDAQGPPYIFQNVLVQDDVIDEIQFPVGQQALVKSIEAATARNLVAIGNVSGVTFPTTGEWAGLAGLDYGDCASVALFGNRSFGGSAMPISNFLLPVLGIDADGLSAIEEATCLAFL